MGDSRLITPATVVAQALGLPIEDQRYRLGYDEKSLTLTGPIGSAYQKMRTRNMNKPERWP